MWVEKGGICGVQRVDIRIRGGAFLFLIIIIHQLLWWLWHPEWDRSNSMSLPSYPKWKALLFCGAQRDCDAPSVQQRDDGGKSHCVNLRHGCGLEWFYSLVFLLLLLSSHRTKILTHHLNHRSELTVFEPLWWKLVQLASSDVRTKTNPWNVQ